MNLKESKEYQKQTRKKPTNVLVSTDVPMQLNEVLIYGKWRLKMVEVLTKEQFIEGMRINEMREDFVSGLTSVTASKIDLENEEPATEPPPDHKYFYRMDHVK